MNGTTVNAIIYCIILPANLFVPLSIKLFHEPTFENAGFLLCLILWIGSEFLASPSFRIIKHWLDHDDPSASNDCPKCIVECSLFLPRDDELHIIMLYRQEMKERQEKLISLRKPKGRGMLLQTLKCMVAIKRKINKKRISESSDSDESEKSDIDNNDYENKGTDENIESDDELENETNLIQRNDHEESAEKVVNGKLQIRVAESKHGEDAN